MFWYKYRAIATALSADLEAERKANDGVVRDLMGRLSASRASTEKADSVAREMAITAEELRGQLMEERAKRIAAETVSGERKSQLEVLRVLLEKMEVARDSAVSAHLADLKQAKTPPVEQPGPAKLTEEQIKALKLMGQGRMSPMQLMERRDRNILLNRMRPKPEAKAS